MIKIGSHISFKSKEYLVGSAQESINNGANCMMIYLGAPQTSRRIDKEKYMMKEYKEKYGSIIKPKDIIVHAPYIVNPSSPEKYQFAIDFLIQEIERMNYIGAKYLVLHPGAHTKFSINEALEQLVKSLNEILERTTNVEILLETMAGKGTEVGISFEQLSFVLKKVNSNRLGICFDTCHAWDSGIDIHNFDVLIKKLKEYDLLDKIKVFHINDSKNEMGAGKDRHANIGSGFIKAEALKKIVNSKIFDGIPMILETPWIDGKSPYKEEIKFLLDK